MNHADIHLRKSDISNVPLQFVNNVSRPEFGRLFGQLRPPSTSAFAIPASTQTPAQCLAGLSLATDSTNQGYIKAAKS